MNTNSTQYNQRKKFFNQFLTVYGRKPALEALQAPGISAYRLHLCETNKADKLLDNITQLAQSKGAEVIQHSRESLSRISKNRKQDQGVAVDIKTSGFHEFSDFIADPPKAFELIALNNITNPQNLGMIIRSVCASTTTGILLPRKGCAKLDSLVIKASAGTLFKAKIIHCDDLKASLKSLQSIGVKLLGMDVHADTTLRDHNDDTTNKVFVLGNETVGLQADIASLCQSNVRIPMQNGVESLNVAVTASLIALRKSL